MGPGRGGHEYLLVLAGTLTRWTKGFATRTESAFIVIKKLLYEIVHQFGLPPPWGSTMVQLSKLRSLKI
mgnify:CR=1 FL=1